MTVSFSRKNIVDRSFKEKIWASLVEGRTVNAYGEVFMEWGLDPSKVIGRAPKRHTIRKGNRWKAGMKIHLVQDNRTPNRYQFAPTIPCISVQDFEVTTKDGYYVMIDGNVLCQSDIDELAVNDGFDSTQEFIEYFNDDFKGQIIHWTDHKYMVG